MGLKAGDTLTVRDLLYGLLLTSGNDAANAVALLCADSLSAFAELMNEKAAVLGMKNTVFVTPSGLDEGEHGSTARDLCLLGAAVLKDPDLSAVCASKRHTITVSGEKRTYQNHNRLLSLYEPAIGLKTGYTVKSGKCLVSAAQKDGVTLVAVTLNGMSRRCDTVVYQQEGLRPLMIVEYKAPHVEITQKVFDQICRYNMVLEVDFLVVSNGLRHYCCQVDAKNGSYAFLEDIPDYDTLKSLSGR
jgi:D-alanyl-D-alanine carboxypeptidase/D-alanyl-D-alanine carboxypeptidase (penicillin-binding protein 5/6)